MKKALAVLLLIAIASVSVFAEGDAEGTSTAPAFPTKPIKLVVYTGPGGAGDILSRKFVDVASKYTDATFVVENKAGAGGIVAMEYVAATKPDGYTLMYMTKSNVSKLVTTDSELDPMTFDWIAQMQIDPEAVITNNKSGMLPGKKLLQTQKPKTVPSSGSAQQPADWTM